ncbi:integrase [Zafaria cholistanensis]|uniref:Integrase n=1 Tax=Zafaria cholistanensis TaxID=1682741 RepID=A0A5A7NR27_9MICC|nr:site-specific integrase [Zafaria cholistanensis]GER23313.1 integrase [Zafaria cholistanensis]
MTEILAPAAPIDVAGTVLAHADAERVRRTLESSISPATKRAYASDWRSFAAWCAAKGYPPLPASAETVIAYLSEAAATVRPDGGWAYAVSTLTRRAAAINAAHVSAGVPAPGAGGQVARALLAIRRERTQGPRRVDPLLTDDLKILLRALADTTWPGAVAATRDAAVLLAGFAGAFRRSELAALNLSDVIPSRHDGVHLRVRRSKTDQEGAGLVKALPFGHDPLTCAPCALYRWMDLLTAVDGAGGRVALMRAVRDMNAQETHVCRRERARTDSEAPLFRSLAGGGAVKDARMSGHAVNEMLKRRAAAAGLDPTRYGGHSLRAGFVTQAFRAGADSRAIRRQTGHRSDTVLAVYDREYAPLVGNAVTAIGL